MSYSPNAYVPPPPPAVKRGKSPWFFVGMGCLGLFVLTLGLIGYAAKKGFDAFQQPLTNQEVVDGLKPVPIYPKAKLDMTTTKVIQGTAAVTRMITGKQAFSAGVFRIPVTPETAVAWYDQEMTKRGYVAANTRQSSIGQKMQNQIQHQYSNKTIKEIVIVQAGIQPEEKTTDPSNATMLIVMRLMGANVKSPGAGIEGSPETPAAK